MRNRRSADSALRQIMRVGMRKGQWWLVILAIIGIAAMESGQIPALTPSTATRTEVQILSVVDGDTIKVRTDSGQLKIRMAGIDAPERDQPFGTQSQAMLTDYLASGNIQLAEHGTDNYGRTLATVYVGDRNINLLMVQSGGAWMYRKYNDSPDFVSAEAVAKQTKAGLWATTFHVPVAPWIWRETKRKTL